MNWVTILGLQGFLHVSGSFEDQSSNGQDRLS